MRVKTSKLFYVLFLFLGPNINVSAERSPEESDVVHSRLNEMEEQLVSQWK